MRSVRSWGLGLRLGLRLGLVLALAGCATQGATAESASSAGGNLARPDAARPTALASAADAAPPAADADAAAAAAAAEPEAPLAWGTRPPREGVLFPVVDGMCIHGEISMLENGALLTYGTTRGAYSRGGQTTAVLVGDQGLEPQTDTGFGSAFGFWGITRIGGHYPDRLWAIVDVSSRLVSAAEIHTGTAKAGDWKSIVDSGARFGEAGMAVQEGVPVRNFGRPLLLDDGSVLIPESLDTRTAKEMVMTYGFRLLDRTGALVAKPKVPGRDLAEIAMQWSESRAPNIAALGNGEVLGLRSHPTPKLVRWSPTRAVDDLPLPAARTTTKLLAGKTRAFVQIDDRLLVYADDKLTPVKASARLAKGYTWTVAKDDTLYVALPDKTLLVEKAAGDVSEEPLPAFGPLHGSSNAGPIWLVAIQGKEPLLHRRTVRGWEPVAIPAPPYGNSLRGPLAIEAITFGASEDDVFVNTRRVEKGWGWRDPEPYRAIYRTKRPKQVLRCQDVRHEQTGHGVHAWPPAAEDGCATPFVVLREEPKVLPKSYPDLAGALRGKTDFGASLTLVDFEGRGTTNLGIPMTSVETARKLATHISKSLDYRADVVCGRPTPTRELTLDVAKGTITTPPAK